MVTMLYPYLYGMIQEDTVHGLSDSFHASERKREIGYTPTYSGSRQILLYRNVYIASKYFTKSHQNGEQVKDYI